MRKSLGVQPRIYPEPVLIIAAYDENGTPYLDFYAGIAVNSSGNCNDKVVMAVVDQAMDIM